jgi:hypothetical protein
VLLVFADAPVCGYKKPKFHELDIRKGIDGVLLKNKVGAKQSYR